MLFSQFRVQKVWIFAGAQSRKGIDLPRLWFHEPRPPFLVPVPNLPFKPFNHKPNFKIFQDSTVLTATLFSVGSTGLRILNDLKYSGRAVPWRRRSGVNPQNLPRCNRSVKDLGSCEGCEATKIKNGNNRKSLLFRTQDFAVIAGHCFTDMKISNHWRITTRRIRIHCRMAALPVQQ